MSNYIFGIETGPRSRAELAECVPTFEAPSNWKDSEKIRAYVAEKEAEWFQSAALSALTGRVLAIGYLDAVTDELGYFASGDEAADLAAFWHLVAPTGYLNSDLIGFSSNRFDLPFLIRRSWHLRSPHEKPPTDAVPTKRGGSKQGVARSSSGARGRSLRQVRQSATNVQSGEGRKTFRV